jgi:hypothetical protein
MTIVTGAQRTFQDINQYAMNIYSKDAFRMKLYANYFLSDFVLALLPCFTGCDSFYDQDSYFISITSASKCLRYKR